MVKIAQIKAKMHQNSCCCSSGGSTLNEGKLYNGERGKVLANDMGFKILPGLKEDQKCIFINDVPYGTVEFKQLPDFERLELSKRLHDHTEKILCSEFFELFNDIRELAEQQKKLLSEIEIFSQHNVQEHRFINENRLKIKENSQNFRHRLNSFLNGKGIEEVSDVMSDDKIADKYMISYFTDNFWFEVFCYYLLFKVIREKKNTWERDKQYEFIISQIVKGPNFNNQIDIILLIKDAMIICSAKSGQEGTNHILEFSKRKLHTGAHIGIVFMFNKLSGEYDGRYEQLYIVQNIRSKTYDQIKAEVEGFLSHLFR